LLERYLKADSLLSFNLKTITMEANDQRLWRIAKKRADFKRHLITYVIMNVFFWAIWWFTNGHNGIGNWAAVWPVWPMLGWGLGIAFQYFEAYGHTDKETAVQQEYEKLKKQQGQ